MTVALITGAAYGLGLEVARQLATTRADVVIAARDPAAATAAAEGLDGVSALRLGLDVGESDSVRRAAESWTEHPGRLDILINNAAGFVDWSELASSADLEAADRVMQVNLYGSLADDAGLPALLRASAHPRIVNVSSGAGSHTDREFGLAARRGAAAAYGVSKAALNALTSTLAAELSETPVIVNAVCPGLTATYPGAEAMGARPVADSAAGVVWVATLADDGPRGGFFRDRESLGW